MARRRTRARAGGLASSSSPGRAAAEVMACENDLYATAQARKSAEGAEAAIVARARAAGMTWSRIADLLELPRQTVQYRHGRS